MAIVQQLNASCKAIVDHARGIADVVNAQFPTYDDLTNSLNESWKDMYEVLTDSSTDYFVTLAAIPVTTTSSSSTLLNPNEYLVSLPNDFYKLAFVDYQWNGMWQRMNLFSKDGRTNYPGQPMYRFQGNALWVIGGMWNSTSFLLRVGYYPIPTALYFPNQTQLFTSGLTDFQQTTITALEYVPGPLPAPFNQAVNPAPGSYNSLIIVQQGTGINFISNNNSTVTQIVASAAALSNPMYYKGVFYWIQAGNIQGAIFNPAAPALLTPVAMTSSGTVTFFDIYANIIYFVDGGTTKSVAVPSTPGAIVGVAVTSPFTPPANIKFYGFISGLPVWITSVGGLVVNNVAVTTSGVISQATVDGTYVYVVISNVLYRLTIDLSTPANPTLNKAEVIATDVAFIADPSQNYIPVFGLESNQLYCYSTFPDLVLTYPNNLAYEAISYQIAMDIKRKQGDAEGGGIIKERFDSIMTRFLDQSRRDDYSPERISNNRMGNSPGGLLGIDF